MLQLKKLLFSIFLFAFSFVFGQNVSLYQQFNGRYDFTFIGNTLNPNENSFQTTPSVFTTSDANLNLNSGDQIEKAYLYWAGCGTGDFNVKLNGSDISAQRTFTNVLNTQYNFFSAFADVTTLVQNTGNGTYTLSELDVSSFINLHYQNRTNFAGWAIIIVYKNDLLPLNQINLYDGMQVVSQFQNNLTINLSALNVVDNIGAKIGFLAWEGDSGLAVNETLRINGTIISNPPLNPANNAFNSTNSITNSSALYNMDLDIYDIQNNIQVGDTSAQIQLTSGQDYVMINSIVTKLNSQLPDATITVNEIEQECNTRTLVVDYTVFNTNSTNTLVAGVPIAIYANGTLIDSTSTLGPIPVNGSENGQITLTIPGSIPNDFTLTFVVDDTGTGAGIVSELNEFNNSFAVEVSLWISPEFNILENLTVCNQGFTQGTFDFTSYESLVKVNQDDDVSFHHSLIDAQNQTNEIVNTSNYIAVPTPKEIFVRIENEHCFSVTSFLLTTVNCPPIVYNYVSANNDGFNETFFIEGLRNIFLNFELEIYNRWGKLIWTGTNNIPDWNGFANEGYRFDSSNSPKGTFYYVLRLNDEGYPEPLQGYLYFTK